jgi:hypothetical protein
MYKIFLRDVNTELQQLQKFCEVSTVIQAWANVGLQLFVWKRRAGYDYYNSFNNNNNNNNNTTTL